MALLLGTLQLSRALDEPRISDALLEDGIHTALTLLGAKPQD
jgi:hypothetical protein